jgi:hypothetical protein
MMRAFFSYCAAFLSHLMTFFVVGIVSLAVHVDHREHASVFLESLLRQAAPMTIAPGVTIGGNELLMIAGPCAVESRDTSPSCSSSRALSSARTRSAADCSAAI